MKGQRILNITNYTATKIDASLMELGGYLYDVKALMRKFDEIKSWNQIAAELILACYIGSLS